MQAAQKLEVTPAPASTARPELDKALETLRAHATDWARSSIADRIALARKMLDGYVAVAEASVLAGCHAKGIDPSSPLASEEWLAGPTVVIRNLRLLIETLERLHAGRPPFDPAKVRTRPDGRVVVEVFPASGLDKMQFAGFSAEVWMQPGTKAQEVTDKRRGALSRAAGEARGQGVARARRRQRRVDPADRRHLQDVRRGQGLPHQDEPGQRPRRAVHREGVQGRRRPRAGRGVLRRRRRRQVPRRARRSSTRSTSPARTRPTT